MRVARIYSQERFCFYKNTYICTFSGGKNLENEGTPLEWGMAEQSVVYDGDGIPLCCKE